MKYLFDNNTESFRQLLSSLKEEIEEEYYYNSEGVPPEQTTHQFAVALILVVFSFVQEFKRERQTLEKMMEYLFILSQGEYLFLTRGNTDIESNIVIRKVMNDNDKSILLAAQYLLYYYDFFMKQEDPARGCRVKDFYWKIVNQNRNPSFRGEKEGEGKPPKVPMDLMLNRDFPLKQKNFFDKYMVGQEELKKKLAMSVYHYLLGSELKAFLMIGDTGTGKNHSIWVLKQFFKENNIKIPVFTYDASKLTPNGFSGENIRNIFLTLKKEQQHYKTKKAIVYLDEVCKAIMPNHDSNGENVSSLVQGQLLSALSGTEIEGVDTSEIFFILGGAFSDLRKLRKTRKQYNPLGFQSSSKAKNTVYSIRNDLIEIGMERELLGRIASIVELEPFDKATIKQILLHEKVGAIMRKKKEYALDELEVRMDEEIPDLICDMVLAQDLGARGAVNVVEDLFGNYNFDMIKNGNSWIRIHPQMLEGAEPIFG